MKKFLTVLLALSVVFTYTVGTAFAATPNPASTTAEASELAFKEVVKDVKDSISYNGLGYATDADQGNGYLSKSVIEDKIDELAKTYIQAIRKATSNWDNEWSAVSTVDEFIATTDLFGTDNLNAMLADQVDAEETAAKAAMAPDLSGYSAADKIAINAVIDTQSTAIETAKNAYKDGTNTAQQAIGAFKVAVAAVKAEMKKYNTATTDAEKLAQAKNDAINALNKAAEEFTEAVQDEYKDSVNAEEISRLNTLTKDVDALVAVYENKIEAVVADEDMTVANKISGLSQIAAAAGATFGKTTPFTKFYSDLTVLNNAEVLLSYADTVAAEKKAAISADGTKTYDPSDVDVKLAEAKKAVNDAVFAAIAAAGAAPTKTTVTDVFATLVAKTYPLAAYKQAAIAGFTTDTYQTADPANSVWSYERYDKVVAIQDKAEEEILLAETTTDVDSIAKKAKEDIDAILTKAQITALETKTEARMNALGYTDTALGQYFDVVVGTNYSDDAKDDIIDAAKQVIKDAVVATENANITNAEVDKIVKDTYPAALAELSKVKTAAELKDAAKAVDTLISALPSTITVDNKEQVLAAQKAYEDYLDLPGTAPTDIEYSAKLKNAMVTLINAEVKAVKDQIRALPDKITVADAAAVEAARAALDALEETYGDYDGTDAFGTATGFTYVATINPTNAGDVDDAEEALEIAKQKDAAEKIAALGSNPTAEAVKAAREAYEALSLNSKLMFNDELYADLLNAEKKVAEATVKAVEALKITASSTAKKGSITVKWTVKGDSSAADGFQVYRSLKMNSGFGTKAFFTTTDNTKRTYKNTKSLKKGTRYYYKIRAYKVVDGVKYYSDWSNKAYRIAK